MGYFVIHSPQTGAIIFTPTTKEMSIFQTKIGKNSNTSNKTPRKRSKSICVSVTLNLLTIETTVIPTLLIRRTFWAITIRYLRIRGNNITHY